MSYVVSQAAALVNEDAPGASEPQHPVADRERGEATLASWLKLVSAKIESASLMVEKASTQG